MKNKFETWEARRKEELENNKPPMPDDKSDSNRDTDEEADIPKPDENDE